MHKEFKPASKKGQPIQNIAHVDRHAEQENRSNLRPPQRPIPHRLMPEGEGAPLPKRRPVLLIVILYVISILLGLVLPIAAVALHFGIVVYLIFPLHKSLG